MYKMNKKNNNIVNIIIPKGVLLIRYTYDVIPQIIHLYTFLNL